MRRVEVLKSVSKIEHNLRTVSRYLNDIKAFLLNKDNYQKDNPHRQKVLEKLQELGRSWIKYDPLDKHITSLFEIYDYSDASFWEQLIQYNISSGDQKGGSRFISNFSDTESKRMQGFFDKLAALKFLFQQENIVYEKGVVASPSKEKEVLTLILPESTGEASSIERVALMLEGIGEINKAVSNIELGLQTELILLATDSGSDKSFDLLGVKNVISAIKDIIIVVYEHLLFYKHAKFAKNIEAIRESLAISEKINSLLEEEKITKEEAGRYKVYLNKGLGKILDVGVLIPEFNENSGEELKKLLSPNPKYLSSPKEEQEKEDKKKKE